MTDFVAAAHQIHVSIKCLCNISAMTNFMTLWWKLNLLSHWHKVNYTGYTAHARLGRRRRNCSLWKMILDQDSMLSQYHTSHCRKCRNRATFPFPGAVEVCFPRRDVFNLTLALTSREMALQETTLTGGNTSHKLRYNTCTGVRILRRWRRWRTRAFPSPLAFYCMDKGVDSYDQSVQ